MNRAEAYVVVPLLAVMIFLVGNYGVSANGPVPFTAVGYGLIAFGILLALFSAGFAVWDIAVTLSDRKKEKAAGEVEA